MNEVESSCSKCQKWAGEKASLWIEPTFNSSSHPFPVLERREQREQGDESRLNTLVKYPLEYKDAA